jgi:putative addiction module killer protein
MLAYLESHLSTEEVENVADAATPKRVIVYADAQGKEPFTLWLNGLRDRVRRTRILARVARLAQGNYGDHAPVGEGVSELRLFFGPGYRVYFGEHGDTVGVALWRGQR